MLKDVSSHPNVGSCMTEIQNRRTFICDSWFKYVEFFSSEKVAVSQELRWRYMLIATTLFCKLNDTHKNSPSVVLLSTHLKRDKAFENEGKSNTIQRMEKMHLAPTTVVSIHSVQKG